MGWRGGSDGNPIDIEILDSTGSVIAGGSASAVEPADQASAEPDVHPSRPISNRTIGIAAAVVLAGIALFFATRSSNDAGTANESLGAPLGLLADGDTELELSRTTADATFPLFGRSWDFELIGSRRGQLEALDLNTGETRDLGRGGDEFGSVQAARVIDDAIFSIGFGGVYRHFDGRAETVYEATGGDDFFGRGLGSTGNYWYASDESDVVVLTHLVTSREIALDGIIDFTAVGDDVFTQAGGQISRIDAEGEAAPWARGEILAVGTNRLAWRVCDGPDSCRYWLGTPGDPNATEIGADFAADALVNSLTSSNFGPGFYSTIALLSPSGREAWRIDTTDSEIRISLVDLVAETSLDLPNSVGALPGVSPDGTLLVAMGDGPGTIAIDTATGEEVMLTTSLEPAGLSYVFAPVE